MLISLGKAAQPIVDEINVPYQPMRYGRGFTRIPVYLGRKVLKSPEANGHTVNEDVFEHLFPDRFAHINRLGRYTFQAADQFAANGLRPLRV